MLKDYRLVVIILGAVLLEIIIAELIAPLTHYQVVAVILSTGALIVLVLLSVYFVLKNDLKDEKKSLSDCIEDVKESLDHTTKQLENSCKRIEIYSKQKNQGKVALIDREQVQDFIASASIIWTMNPLSDLSSIEPAITKSMENNECKRIYIVPYTEYNKYVSYLNHLQYKMRDTVDVKSLVKILRIDPTQLFPLSFVICDPFDPDDGKVWIQPKDMEKEDHAIYIGDGDTVSKFTDTFTTIQKELEEKERDINHE